MGDISKDVIDRAVKGDIRAFEEIYRKTSAFVYNVALRITNNCADADEVMQDVFMKVYRKLGEFNFLSSFKTWVYRIAVNTAINYKKTIEKHVTQRSDYDSTLRGVSTKEEARGNIDKQDKKKQLSVLLDMLNPNQRACIVLREIQGLNYKEMADILRININTVRTRLKRARQRLVAFAGKR